MILLIKLRGETKFAVRSITQFLDSDKFFFLRLEIYPDVAKFRFELLYCCIAKTPLRKIV